MWSPGLLSLLNFVKTVYTSRARLLFRVHRPMQLELQEVHLAIGEVVGFPKKLHQESTSDLLALLTV